MSASTTEILRYLSLLADPDQERITNDAWTVVDDRPDIFWMGWAPDSVISVPNPPPARWYERRPVPRAWTPTPALGDTRVNVSALLVGIEDASADQDWTPPPGSADPRFERLARLDELQREQYAARAGWLWICGSIMRGGNRVPCCFPLFERVVRFVQIDDEVWPQWLGLLRPHRLLADLGDHRYEDLLDRFVSLGAGGAAETDAGAKVVELLEATGIRLDSQAPADTHPMSIAPEVGTVLVPGTGMFLATKQRAEIAPGSNLHRWGSAQLGFTALAEIYRSTDAMQVSAEPLDRTVRSVLPLNERQRTAIGRLDSETVVAISGPPGTGKTHMIVAAASDAVARGMSVLIATKSEFAAESVSELLAAYPTPPYLRFGSEQHRRAVADRLSAGTPTGLSDAKILTLSESNDANWTELERLGRDTLSTLAREQAFERGRHAQDVAAADVAPRVTDEDFDVAELDDMLTRLASDNASWFSRRRERKLRSFVGADPDAPLAVVMRGIAAARVERDMRSAVELAKGSQLDTMWAQLERVETKTRTSQAELDMAKRARPDRAAMASIAALATRLRSADHRSLSPFAEESDPAFLKHLPLWVGTLDEIEATLPAVAAMFDLVIFDEASQIDQISAAPALCRAERTLVVGDPKQLRHRSAITDAQVKAAQHHASIPPGPTGQLLEVQHNSLFDLAAAATPVTWLDEHFFARFHI